MSVAATRASGCDSTDGEDSFRHEGQTLEIERAKSSAIVLMRRTFDQPSTPSKVADLETRYFRSLPLQFSTVSKGSNPEAAHEPPT